MENTTTPTTSNRRPVYLALIGVGVAVVLAGMAWASVGGPAGFGHGFGKAHVREFAEFRVHRALKQVGATEAQEEQLLAIMGGLFARHEQLAGAREELHQRAAAALTAETVDRAALEAIRVDALRRLDEGSKELVKSIGDAAEVLTPAQRRQLLELHTKHGE